MKHTERNNRKLTFGNILLTLLVLGTLVVIGLMGKLYIELTKTPEKTEQMHKERQQNNQQVEVMSPNAKPGDEPVYRNNTLTASKPVVAPSAQQATTNLDVPATNNEPLLDNPVLTDTGVSSANVNKKTNQVKKDNKNKEQIRVETDTNVVAGERPLIPTNAPSRQQQPVASPQQKEIPLKPRESKKSNDAIDELF